MLTKSVALNKSITSYIFIKCLAANPNKNQYLCV